MKQTLIQDLSIIVILSTLSTWIFSKLKLPILLGFIVVGIIIVPVDNLLQNREIISELGELGVLFMMFFVGMEFNPDKLKKVFVPSLLGIGLQIFAMGALGLAVADMMGLSSINGIFLGGGFAMSSTVVIMEVFEARGDLNKRYAQISVGILIMEDLFAIFLLVVLSGIAKSSSVDFLELGKSSSMLLTFVVSIYILGKLLINPILKRFSSIHSTQVLIMLTMCFMLGLSELARSAGLSLALGAFLAGSILSGTDISRKVEHIILPFRNLFVALFFVSIGTMIEPELVVNLWLPIILISIALIAFQSLASFCGIVIGGETCKTAFKSAINNAQIGEFGFVIATLGINLGVIDKSVMIIVMGVSFLTVFLNPFVSNRADKICASVKRHTPESILLALKTYKNFVDGFLRTGESGRSKNVWQPLSVAAIYGVLFNALMLITGIAYDWMKGSEYFESENWFLTIFIPSALISIPILIGHLSYLAKAVSGLIKIDKNSSVYKRRLLEVVRFFISALVLLAFIGVYFLMLRHYLPTQGVVYFYMLLIFVFALIAGQMFMKLNKNLESKFTGVFKRHLENAESYKAEQMLGALKTNYSWSPEIVEVKISEHSVAVGRNVRELGLRQKYGADICAIKRGELIVYKVMPDAYIFPDDTLFLSGSKSEVLEARNALLVECKESESSALKSFEMHTEAITLSENSPLCNKTLAQIELTKNYSASVLGITEMGSAEMERPNPHKLLKSGDTLLMLGDFDDIQRFKSNYIL